MFIAHNQPALPAIYFVKVFRNMLIVFTKKKESSMETRKNWQLFFISSQFCREADKTIKICKKSMIAINSVEDLFLTKIKQIAFKQ